MQSTSIALARFLDSMRIPALALGLILTLPFALIAQKGIRYDYYQSSVRHLPQGPTPFAYPVCDMLETFVGLPARLDAKRLLREAAGKQFGLVSTFYQFMLEENGLLREDSLLAPEDSAAGYVNYRCPKGTVLTLQDPARITSPDKIVSMLKQGIKGIAVSYAYMPRDWKKGNWQLDRSRGRAKGRHAVLIVGYQDSSLIFKNSWGEQWGDHGYGTMSFDYHRAHAQEGLISYLAEANDPKSAISSGLALKVQPEILELENYVQVSLVSVGQGKLPAIVELSYALSQGSSLPREKRALIMSNGKSTGYPCLIPIASITEPFDLTVRYKVANGDPKVFEIKGLRWKNAEFVLDRK